VIDKFTTYLKDSGTELEDVNPVVISDFRKDLSKGNGAYHDMGCLRSVFELGVKRGVVHRNPVEAETRPIEVEYTEPYSREELARLEAVCTSKEDKLVYMLFRWTGMRGSDVADLKASEVHFPDEIRRVALKNRANLLIPIGEDLKKFLEGLTNGNVVRYNDKNVDRAFLGRRMRHIYDKAKIVNGHNHRFRATFAVDLLLKGATVFDVAKALGDETRTVEKHYLKYVPQTRDRLKSLIDAKGGI
jgi:integrase